MQAKAIAKPRRAMLNWVDYLVIAATVLTFLAVVIANNPHSKRASTFLLRDVAPQTGQMLDSSDLMKARMKMAIGT
jgi:hypothetical protein